MNIYSKERTLDTFLSVMAVFRLEKLRTTQCSGHELGTLEAKRCPGKMLVFS